ncbi:MAG: hypothetical protein F9K32_09875 [Desulfobulbaceae bacterium]|nr:MAG: hypothetical protein F9K32_09875 [Desulfobulbaceae bacterium]
MKDISTLRREIIYLEQKDGKENIHWDSRRFEWLAILNYLLPPRLNRRQTRIILLLPEGYGNGMVKRTWYVLKQIFARW